MKRNATPSEWNYRLFLLINYDEKHKQYISGYTYEHFYPTGAADEIVELTPTMHALIPYDMPRR